MIARKIVARDQPGILELRQHPIHGGETDLLTGLDEPTIDLFRAEVLGTALLQDFQNPQPGSGGLEPRLA